jgi:predicted SAM-dependent methyltransferase
MISLNPLNWLRQSHAFIGLTLDIERIHKLLLRYKARLAFSRYLRQTQIRKLQIGAGLTKNSGWLVTDIATTLRSTTIYLDASRQFPIPDASFDYIFSEHMIEHISYPAACAMLKECFRVMKPGARIRIATPDLDRFLSLQGRDLNDVQRAYVEWVTKFIMPPSTPNQPIFAINNQFRNYGHQFLFDEACLRDALSNAGFVAIKRMPVGESDDAQLNHAEQHGINVNNEAMVAYETMVLEAQVAVIN